MKIAICDDNKYDIEHLLNCIQKYFKDKILEKDIDLYINSKELLKKIYKYDFVFLDIDLNNENGIDVGLKIREASLKTIIIITSKHPRYIIEGYKIRADRFFIKPINYEEFVMEMDDVIRRYYNPYIMLNDKNNFDIKLELNDIMYIEIIERHTEIHLASGKIIKSSLTIKELLEKIKNINFGQPHKSFIVNFNYINKFQDNYLVLMNSIEIPLTRHYKSEFENKYYESLHGCM